MTETSETTTANAQQSVSAEELAALITEFEQYRERLINETLTIAQKAKQPKKKALARIEPELAQIDAGLQKLRDQQAASQTAAQ